MRVHLCFFSLAAGLLLQAWPVAAYPVDKEPREVAGADLNHDGRVNLVTATFCTN